MNKFANYNGETSIKLEDEQLGGVESTTERHKFQATVSYLPVYNTRNNVYRGRLIGVDIEDTTIKPEKSTFQDFGMKGNMELSKNHFVFNWPYHIKLNRMTGALFTTFFIMFLWFIFGLSEWFSKHAIEFDSLFFIIKLYVAGTVAGEIISMVCDIPPSVGMVLVGIALSNSARKLIEIKLDLFVLWFYLYELIESVILIIGGLEMNLWDLRWTGFTVLKLAILPQIAESVSVILVVHYFWPDILKLQVEKYLLVNMLGIHSVLFMPNLEKLKDLGYFDTNNIYTLLNAASSTIDMAAVIFNYFVIRSISFEYSKITENISHVAAEVLIDIVFGIVWGFIVFVSSLNLSIQYNKHTCRDTNDQEVNRQITRFITTVKSVVLLFFGGILVVIIKISIKTAWSFSLPSGISSLVAGTFWRWRIKNTYNSNAITMTYNDGNEYENHHHAVLKVFNCFWKYLQPLFFGFIGAGFQFEYFSFWMLLIGPLVLVFELTIRILITTFSIWGSGFNRFEQLFINIASLPNSTLMASCMLMHLSGYEYKNQLKLQLIGNVCNLTIILYLITTLLGSFSVLYYGPILLSMTINNK